MFDLSERNKKAWDDLYRATDQPVWGRLPIGFLTEFLGYVTPRLGVHSRVLDAGAGEGRNVASLEQTDARVCVCDASAHALRKIRMVVHDGVRRAQCDLSSLPFSSNIFDLVLMTDVVETLPDPDPALSEAYRVLKPGGMLLCNIPGDGDPIAEEDMHALDGETYLYRGRYFYRFIDVDAAAAYLRRHHFDIARAEQRAWTEEAHPTFRSYAHRHISNVFLGVKRGAGASPEA
jgi:SAM-dependent methyltransferase